MGDPKYSRRVWRKPKRPLNYDLKMEELKTLGTFGLKTKRELWKARTELSRVRHQARSLLALGREVREEKEPILLRSLSRIGLVKNDSTLDDVLNLQVEDLLSRRLQTFVMKKMGFATPYQARQAVVHGHVMINDRIVDIPSYVVTVDEEEGVRLAPSSSLESVIKEIEKRRGQKQEAAENADAAADADSPEPEKTDGDKADAPDSNAASDTENAASEDKVQTSEAADKSGAPSPDAEKSA